MKSLLNQLSQESFLLDLKEPLQTAPTLKSATTKLNDALTLEITCDKSTSINQIFSELTQGGVEVLSLRNKSNRLEELFMRLVDADQEQDASKQGVSDQGRETSNTLGKEVRS